MTGLHSLSGATRAADGSVKLMLSSSISLAGRFGVPDRIVTIPNFELYYANLGMQICDAFVAHVRGNGQAECART